MVEAGTAGASRKPLTYNYFPDLGGQVVYRRGGLSRPNSRQILPRESTAARLRGSLNACAADCFDFIHAPYESEVRLVARPARVDADQL